MKHLPSLLDEVETSEQEMDQSREEPDEIMDINHENESKFEKSDEHEMFESKGRFCECYMGKLNQKRYKATSVKRPERHLNWYCQPEFPHHASKDVASISPSTGGFLMSSGLALMACRPRACDQNPKAAAVCPKS
ncbi:hypothetical protein TNCV_986961 [Trichonephila clavipes]|nr:hypothetical protein TNCV_986961 [Trichonephila clavipes]